MTGLLMTGFPGFLGSALLGRLLARRDGVRAICLVQPRHHAEARSDRGRSAARRRPPTVRELVTTFARHLHKRVVWVPLPLGPTRRLVSLPGVERLLGIPAESLDYFASPTTYDTAHTSADLEGTGVACPAFGSYADRLLDYMVEHPEIDAAAMI